MNINFFATYRCNSRCVNCSIWKGAQAPAGKSVLTAVQLERLFASPLFTPDGAVGIAGGEPTIDPFFDTLLDTVPAHMPLTITTNALNSRKLLDRVSGISNPLLIQISIDGMGRINDEMRGVPGAFDRAVDLLAELKARQIRTLISFTINRKNISQIREVYRLALENGALFSTRLAYCGGAYDNRESAALFDFTAQDLAELDRAIDSIVDREVQRDGHHPAQAVFWDRITDCHRDRKHQLEVPCRAMDTDVVVDLYGDVFPNCPVLMDRVLGNITTRTIDDIMTGSQAQKVREDIARFRCGGCWNDCQVVTNIDHFSVFRDRHYDRIRMRGLKTIPHEIDFNTDGDFCLLSGWHDLETGEHLKFRWTQPEFALPVPAGTRAVEIFGGVPDTLAGGKDIYLKVTVEGTGHRSGQTGPVTSKVKIGSTAWRTHRLDLDRPVPADSSARFSLNRFFRPCDVSDSRDARKLAMAVSSIRFIVSV